MKSRKQIIREHEQYQKGLLFFMANDPGVPKDVREAMSKWGLAKDEFTETGWMASPNLCPRSSANGRALRHDRA